jgi:hypothetical protein
MPRMKLLADCGGVQRAHGGPLLRSFYINLKYTFYFF